MFLCIIGWLLVLILVCMLEYFIYRIVNREWNGVLFVNGGVIVGCVFLGLCHLAYWLITEHYFTCG